MSAVLFSTGPGRNTASSGWFMRTQPGVGEGVGAGVGAGAAVGHACSLQISDMAKLGHTPTSAGVTIERSRCFNPGPHDLSHAL